MNRADIPSFLTHTTNLRALVDSESPSPQRVDRLRICPRFPRREGCDLEVCDGRLCLESWTADSSVAPAGHTKGPGSRITKH